MLPLPLSIDSPWLYDRLAFIPPPRYFLRAYLCIGSSPIPSFFTGRGCLLIQSLQINSMFDQCWGETPMASFLHMRHVNFVVKLNRDICMICLFLFWLQPFPGPPKLYYTTCSFPEKDFWTIGAHTSWRCTTNHYSLSNTMNTTTNNNTHSRSISMLKDTFMVVDDDLCSKSVVLFSFHFWIQNVNA